MSESSLSQDADFDRAFQARLVEARKAQAARFYRELPGWEEARAWLALVPAWTEELATACNFPTHNLSIPKFIESAQRIATGVQRKDFADGREGKHFWMSNTARAETLSELRRVGRKNLVSLAADIGRRILTAEENGVSTSEIVSRWARIARLARPGLHESAQFLIKQVAELLQGENRETGQALSWLNAGRALAESLGGPLESAIRVGEHGIELAYRQEQDERHLEHFLSRKDQIDAFEYLVDNSDGVWALHYVGMGGVGKTMILRHITARLAPERKIPTSRVDFDYLSPDYPVRRPGQLLLELSAELRSYITDSKQEYLFGSFQDQAITLHESLSNLPPADDPLSNIRGSGFKLMLGTFCDFLRMLPQPVVLILDTCEELAKVQLSGGQLPVLEATFEILEQLQQAVPGVRLIFAGRRLLARGGSTWRIAASEAAMRAYLPQRKEYLALQNIHGFDDHEAADYLDRIEGLKLRKDLREAILGRSRDASAVDKIIWVPERPRETKPRYNPFDLSLYAQWVKADPNLDAGSISSGRADPYVESRIVHRINNPAVKAILPAVVLLRRFNRDMLAPALGLGPKEIEDVYSELGDQEWIEHQHDEALQTTFLEINRNLYDRLYSYYAESSRRNALDHARENLWPHLVRLVDELSLKQLSTDHLDAALRLAPTNAAAAVLEHLSRRIVSEQNWNWAQQVTGRILAEDGALEQADHPLRAFVLAINAAAVFHENPTQDLTAVWNEIGKTAELYPDPKVASWLRYRARIKKLAAFDFPKDADSDYRWDLFRRWIADLTQVFDELKLENSAVIAGHYREQLLASFCAAIEACLDRTPPEVRWDLQPGDLINLQLPKKIAQLTDSRELDAQACCLTARALARNGKWSEAFQLMERAETIASSISPGDRMGQAWEDWRAPDLFRERIRLEFLTTIPPRFRAIPQSTLIVWRQEAIDLLHLIDAERLVSLTIKLSLAHAVMPEADLEFFTATEKYDLSRKPVCPAHRAVPPLFVSLAMGWLARGRLDNALPYVRDRREAALSTRSDPETVRAAEIAELKIIRRMRLHNSGTELINRLARSDDPDVIVCVRELLGVNSPVSPDALLSLGEEPEPALLHAWWRSQATLTPLMARDSVDRMRKLAYRFMSSDEASKEDHTGSLAQLKLDWLEASILAKEFAFAVLSNPSEFVFSGEDWWKNNPTRTEDGLRLAVRTDALQGRTIVSKRLRDQVGPRLVAEVALEEGELLALRLPKRAVALLNQAYTLFCDAQDWIGATLALEVSSIAEIHAGQLDPARARVRDGLMKMYNDVAANSGLEIPTTSELNELFKESNPSLITLEKTQWGGWLPRLVRILAWQLEGSGGARTAVVNNWLKATYGHQLPIELALTKGEMKAAGVGFMMAPLMRRAWRNIWPLLGCTAIGWVLLGIMGALQQAVGVPCLWLPMLVGISLIFRAGFVWLRDNRGIPIYASILAGIGFSYGLFWVLIILATIFEGTDGTIAGARAKIIWTIATSSVLIVAAFVLTRFARKPIEAWLTSHNLVALGIHLNPIGPTPVGDSSEEVLVSIAIDQTPLVLKWYFPVPRRVRSPEIGKTWRAHGPESSYLKAATDIPWQIANELTYLNKKLRQRRLPIALQIEPGVAQLPWEAVFSLALPKNQDQRLQFWRSGEALPLSNFTFLDAEGVNVLGSETWGEMVESGWGRVTKYVPINDFSTKLDRAKPRKILHLIGQAVETTAGLRLQMSTTVASEQPPSIPASSMASGADSGTRRNDLLGFDALPVRSSALVVVQGEPIADLTPRLKTDRLQSARLRAYAAGVFDSGAQAVVVLPTLPPELAQKVLEILATALKTGPQTNLRTMLTKPKMYLRRVLTEPELNLRTLLITVDQIRATIQDRDTYSATVERTRKPAPDPQLIEELIEARAELALDVCLYARENFQMP